MASNSNTDFKQVLWKSADKLRAQMDAFESKNQLMIKSPLDKGKGS